jgi:hypothetical protein
MGLHEGEAATWWHAAPRNGRPEAWNALADANKPTAVKVRSDMFYSSSEILARAKCNRSDYARLCRRGGRRVGVSDESVHAKPRHPASSAIVAWHSVPSIESAQTA